MLFVFWELFSFTYVAGDQSAKLSMIAFNFRKIHYTDILHVFVR